MSLPRFAISSLESTLCLATLRFRSGEALVCLFSSLWRAIFFTALELLKTLVMIMAYDVVFIYDTFGLLLCCFCATFMLLLCYFCAAFRLCAVFALFSYCFRAAFVLLSCCFCATFMLLLCYSCAAFRLCAVFALYSYCFRAAFVLLSFWFRAAFTLLLRRFQGASAGKRKAIGAVSLMDDKLLVKRKDRRECVQTRFITCVIGS